VGLTLAYLRKLPDLIDEFGEAAQKRADGSADAAGEIKALRDASSWQGSAREAADDALNRKVTALDASQERDAAVVAAARGAHDRAQRTVAELNKLQDFAEQQPVCRIDEATNTVTPPNTNFLHDDAAKAAEAKFADVQNRVAQILTKGEEADFEFGNAIKTGTGGTVAPDAKEGAEDGAALSSGKLTPNTIIDTDHPFVGDERFGQWENYTPPPYVGATPPPPPLEHRPLDGVAARPGGPSNFYTPGRTWVADSDAPFASQSEAYRFRITGMDATSYTRTVTINGHQQLQRWVGYTYEAQRISKVDVNGSIWSKSAPGTPATLLPGTGGLGGLGFGQKFGAWHSVTPNQMANLSALNPTATYYIPDGCGGAFNFVSGVPTGGIAPPPTIPVMTAPR